MHHRSLRGTRHRRCVERRRLPPRLPTAAMAGPRAKGACPCWMPAFERPRGYTPWRRSLSVTCAPTYASKMVSENKPRERGLKSCLWETRTSPFLLRRRLLFHSAAASVGDAENIRRRSLRFRAMFSTYSTIIDLQRTKCLPSRRFASPPSLVETFPGMESPSPPPPRRYQSERTHTLKCGSRSWSRRGSYS